MDRRGFFFQAEDGIRDKLVTGVQTCALPILPPPDGNMTRAQCMDMVERAKEYIRAGRSEEHTSELQSLAYLVCPLLLENKKTPKMSSWPSIKKTLISTRQTSSEKL